MKLLTIAERPLRGGVRRDAPGQELKPGEFVTLENVLATDRGLYRPPKYRDYANGDTFEGDPLGIVTLWNTAGAQVTVFVTNDRVYTASELGGLTEVEYVYSTGTITASGTTITGSGTAWADAGIQVNDYFALTSGARVEIASVNNTALTLDESVGAAASGTAYTIYRRMYNENPDVGDWEVVDGDLVVTTRQRTLAKLDTSGTSTVLTDYITTTTLLPGSSTYFHAGCLSFYNERLFIGDVTDNVDGRKRQRVRWSTVTNKADFSTTTAYYDIPYTTTHLKRLVPLGPVLVAYFGDMIFIGQSTEDAALPVVFQPVDSGGIGLVAQRGVVSTPNAHFFAGQDNIYRLTVNGIEAVGDAIARDSIQTCSEKWRIQGAIDTNLNRVVFGIPDDENDYFTHLWSFDYRVGAWSSEVLSTQALMIANPAINNTVTWAEMTAYGWNDVDTSWEDLGVSDAQQSLVVSQRNALEKQDKQLSLLTTDYESVVVTRDFDFDKPDALKSFKRLGLKCEWQSAPTTNVTFTVEGSVNKGVSWKSLGSLVVKPSRDEGYCDFALVGSTARFRLTTSATQAPFYINELTVRLRGSGQESALGTQD